jgi:hypothetical protein
MLSSAATPQTFIPVKTFLAHHRIGQRADVLVFFSHNWSRVGIWSVSAEDYGLQEVKMGKFIAKKG